MTKIAVLDDYQNVAMNMAEWGTLSADCEVRFFNDWINPSKLSKELHDFDVIAAMRERTVFDKKTIESLTNLKLLVTTGMRNASIDIDAAHESGVLVCGTSGSSYSTAELTWGLILSLARNIPLENKNIRLANWQTSLGIDLEGKTLGILGLGRLGGKVATIGISFGMSIIAWSQNLTEDVALKHKAKLVTKEQLFAESDVLTIHLQLSDRTRGLVGEKELGLMKASSYLVNTSRSPIVDCKALIKILENKSIKGAGLDVFDVEPINVGDQLLNLDNTVLTPHIGYVTEEVYKIFYRETLENIAGWLSGNPMRILNP
jgi:phosphoglycerate dehydrogenase-like enzyme